MNVSNSLDRSLPPAGASTKKNIDLLKLHQQIEWKKKKKQLERSFPSNTHKTISIQQNERLWNEFTRLNRETKSWDKKQENKHQNNANPNYIIRRSNLFIIFMIKSYKFQLQANHIFDASLDGFSNKYRISKLNQHFEIIGKSRYNQHECT